MLNGIRSFSTLNHLITCVANDSRFSRVEISADSTLQMSRLINTRRFWRMYWRYATKRMGEITGYPTAQRRRGSSQINATISGRLVMITALHLIALLLLRLAPVDLIMRYFGLAAAVSLGRHEQRLIGGGSDMTVGDSFS